MRMREARRSAPLPARIEITDDFLWLLGLYVAAGCMLEQGRSALVALSGWEELLESVTRRETDPATAARKLLETIEDG